MIAGTGVLVRIPGTTNDIPGVYLAPPENDRVSIDFGIGRGISEAHQGNVRAT